MMGFHRRLIMGAAPLESHSGFMKMVDYLERIADRSIKLDKDWANESAQLQDEGKSLDQIRARQSQ